MKDKPVFGKLKLLGIGAVISLLSACATQDANNAKVAADEAGQKANAAQSTASSAMQKADANEAKVNQALNSRKMPLPKRTGPERKSRRSTRNWIACSRRA